MLSGVVEPIGAVLTLLAAQLVIPTLPYLLSFQESSWIFVHTDSSVLLPSLTHRTKPLRACSPLSSAEAYF